MYSGETLVDIAQRFIAGGYDYFEWDGTSDEYEIEVINYQGGNDDSVDEK